MGDKIIEKYIGIIKYIINHTTEEERFEFKENWIEAHGIGEYIRIIKYSRSL